MREVREGRGSPHGGVFLDISWIKSKMRNAPEHIKKKLPSMYHQFKQLADIDITAEPMEVGPTTHYVMGGVRVDGDSQMSTLPGFSPRASAAAVYMARTASAEIRCPIFLCLECALANTRRSTPRTLSPPDLSDASR